MTELRIGDIEKLARAVADSKANPDVNAYLITLGLEADELESVKKRIADINLAVSNPADSSVPTIVSWHRGWL